MAQLTSVQLIDAALWRELGAMNRSLRMFCIRLSPPPLRAGSCLIKSDSPEIDALKFICQVKANIDRPERFLAVSNCG
jgi:hypothetical protein